LPLLHHALWSKYIYDAKNPLFLSCLIIPTYSFSLSLDQRLLGEGLNNSRELQEIGKKNVDGAGAALILQDVVTRPASATPTTAAADNLSTTSSLATTAGQSESLTTVIAATSAAAANIADQSSPARSPHARSWTVPGVSIISEFYTT
jgi:hypothetical protein